jgi:hypothetical protein
MATPFAPKGGNGGVQPEPMLEVSGPARANGSDEARASRGNASTMLDENAAHTELAAAAPLITDLLTEITGFVRQYVVLSEHQSTVIALWTLHTHVFEAFDTTPYLSVTSPEKQCGKTRLIETLLFVVRRAWQTSNPTVAAFYRKIEQDKPTLLLDETDAIWAGREESYQELRGALNTGYRRGGSVARCVRVGPNQVVRNFATFCPKLLAGIGKVPETVADRSIPLRLERKRRSEQTKPFRFRDAHEEAAPLLARIEEWAASVDLESLRDARPEPIEGISDRAQDCWEPLLAVAELAGGGWTTKAHRAGAVLGGDRGDDSRAVQLLRDIREAFQTESEVTTATLLARLTEDRSKRWTIWLDHQGEVETGAPRKLAILLEEFKIKPRTVRVALGGGQTKDSTLKGYRREDFADAWERYL